MRLKHVQKKGFVGMGWDKLAGTGVATAQMIKKDAIRMPDNLTVS